MQEIAQEETALRSEMGELALRLESAGMAAAQVEAARGVLGKLGQRLWWPDLTLTESGGLPEEH